MYHRYGGRGISHCDEWKDFEPFHEWAMESGYKDGLSIDRIDNNGDYCPENCRWVTASDNSKNRRNNVFIIIYGDRYCAADACKMFNVKRTTVTEAVRLGRKTPTDAFADALERSK